MRCVFFAIGLLATPLGTFALTWDFDDGTTWGWTARESALSTDRGSVSTVYSEVTDGVWRIAPVPGAQRPAIQLRSPWVGEESALFDRVTLRLRIIHHRPTEGGLQMWWFNTEYKRSIDAGIRPRSRPFTAGRPQLYPTDWENITIDLRALELAAEANPEAAITWQDTLFEFHLDLNLNDDAQGPDDHPEFLEVDWIQLTGVEELLLGELLPREIAVEAGLPSALFDAPDFFPLGDGVEVSLRPRDGNGTLGDIDGDGDVDLVVAWNRFIGDGSVLPERHWGWTVAFNDGRGGFVSTREVIVGTTTGSPRVKGGDFDENGLLDLAVETLGSVELWHNRGQDGFEPILQLSEMVWPGLSAAIGLSSTARNSSFPCCSLGNRWARLCACYGTDRATSPRGLGN